jgi:capsule biosynthesis phosphatase
MRICFDLDGVLCELRKPGESYADVKPIPGAAEKLVALRNSGHEIVIATARHMKTCEHSVGKVVARQGKMALDWLERHGFVYDEIWFGKPHCDIYIDDNAYRFTTMDAIADDGSNLPRSCEATQKSQCHTAIQP